MKKALVFIICFVFIFCGCKEKKEINTISKPFSAIVSIKKDNYKAKYKYSFVKTGECSFISLNADNIDYSWKGNQCMLNSDNIQYKPQIENIKNSPVVITKYAIEKSINQIITPAHNGELVYYISGSYGEIKVNFNVDGYPENFIAKNYDLEVKVSELEVDA